MKIYIEKKDKIISKKFNGTLKKLLLTLNINPETVIVVLNNELINENANICDNDELKILSVVSGG